MCLGKVDLVREEDYSDLIIGNQVGDSDKFQVRGSGESTDMTN